VPPSSLDEALAAVPALRALPDDAVVARLAPATSLDDEVAASLELWPPPDDAAAARVAPPSFFVDAVAALFARLASLADAFAAVLAVAQRESASHHPTLASALHRSPRTYIAGARRSSFKLIVFERIAVLQPYGKLPRALIAVFMSMSPFHDTGTGALPVALGMIVIVLLVPLAKSRRFAPTPLITSVRVAGPSRVES